MAFGNPNGPPPTASNAPLPAPPPKPAAMTYAQMSAMGTTAGAPTMQTSKGPPNGSGQPGSGPPPATPGSAQPPPAISPPAGAPNSGRPPVAAHASQRSVGTHASRSPNKRANPAHGMTKSTSGAASLLSALLTGGK